MPYKRKQPQALGRLESVPEEDHDIDIELCPIQRPTLEEPLFGKPKDAVAKIRQKTTGTTIKDRAKDPLASSPEQEALLSKRGSHWEYGLGLLKKADDFVVREVEATTKLASFMQCLGCTTNKAYEVVDKTSGKILLLAEEKAGFLNRNCIHPECRPVKFHVYAYENGETQHMMYVERGFSFIGKWKKPLVLKTSEQEGSRVLGEVRNSSNPVKVELTMCDAKGNESLTIRGSQCTAARWFGKLPCTPCQRITYNFFAPDGETPQAGSMFSQWNGCCQELLLDVSQYDLDLQNLSDLEKAEVVAAAIYSDIRYVQTGSNLRDIVLKKITRINILQEVAQTCGGGVRAITRSTA
eukprot:GHVP01053222.1.p1 GENE.GHVP01053222.1~~GHVP01053222.1.p1  ORF type:complete len:353 (-),score=60.04 GHVP01053222.1:133-1191(-)